MNIFDQQARAILKNGDMYADLTARLRRRERETAWEETRRLELFRLDVTFGLLVTFTIIRDSGTVTFPRTHDSASPYSILRSMTLLVCLMVHINYSSREAKSLYP
jgi:hypothetical protein